MNILQYITPSRLGGAEEYFGRLIEHLCAQHHTVHVVTKRDTPLRELLEHRAKDWPNLQIHGWHTRGKFDAVTLSRLVRLIRRERIEIVHTHLTTASWNGNWAGRLSNVPVVAHVHAADSKTWFQWAHYQIAVARGVKMHLVNQGVPSHRVPVLYYGLDLERHNRAVPKLQARQALNLPADARVIGVIASLIERKGHRFLLQAMHDIRAQIDARGPLHAVFAGEGPLLDDLKTQAKNLNLQDRVHFLGFCANADEVMAACDICALPSAKEGLSIAIMEAMALRVPVVATNVAGMPELVRDGQTGLLIEPENSQQLAVALKRLLLDDDLALRLGAQGREWMEKQFDQRHCLAEVEAFLHDVTQQWKAGRRVNCDDWNAAREIEPS